MIRLLEPGTPAPALDLPDERRWVCSLDEWAGRWLCVWWSPASLAKVCKSCGQQIVQVVRPLLDAGVALVGVTMDSPEENAERSLFVFESLFPILSADWATANAWGAARPQESPWAAVPHPVAYLVRPDGVIERSWFVSEHSKEHIDEAIDTVLGALA